MLVIHSYALAILMCIITMICWGSWANTTKLIDVKQWPFQLFYWDFTIGIIIFSLIFALTAGSMGAEGRPFFSDLIQASLTSFGYAILGGIVFNLGNILLVVAINLSGMAVAFPIGVGLALIIGVIINYIAIPQGNPIVLFIGVACVSLAIVLTAIAYGRIQNTSGTKVKGVLTAIAAGIILGWFFRFVASSMSVNFTAPSIGKFTPYTALVIFSIGVFLSSFVWNLYLMKHPIDGKRISCQAYFKGSLKEHSIGLLGGIIWCIGMGFSLVASGSAGYAVSYGLGQGATMVAVIWGVFIWKEFSPAPQGTNRLLFLYFSLTS